MLFNEKSVNSAVQLPVESLTVIYGENGEGKTTLLLDVCRTLNLFGREARVGINGSERPLGVVWRDKAGLIRLDPGSLQAALRLSGPMTTTESVRPEGRFGTVFYTTSPFESARRRELNAGGTMDVTPSFGTNSFSGTSLCQAASSLPKDIPFIRHVRIQLEISESLDISEEIQKFSSAFLPEELSAARSKRKSHLTTLIDNLKKLSLRLNARTSFLLAIELHRARLNGLKAMEMLLLDLIDRDGHPVGSDAVNRFLASQEARSRGRITTPHILKALERLKKVVIDQEPKGLPDYARALRSVSSMVIAGLQEAENLGLLHWNFLELSSGQVALLMLFASLSAALEKLRKRGIRSVVLVVDEGEMFMHPAWQRKYLRDLMNFIAHYREFFDEIHLILATHSLIVAGDAPPNRLFDVKSCEMRNGFAYGPKEVLTDVYGVDDFSGNIAESLYEKIVTFLRTPNPTKYHKDEVQGLIEQVASDQLRNFLLREIQQPEQGRNA
ncbi:AAA family ATPase [Burkholderia sp. Bp9099]|uniref:AAA family ATPase n=1 Tax=Burkholderia sp. Bp9099 TaxID=2184568 RepID=UPI00163B503B|nr:AAA family ATPase [Burkholderia sp. Bp9099]